MKKLTRALSILVALTMLLALLTACGGNADGNTSTGSADGSAETVGMLSAIGSDEQKMAEASENTKWIFYDNLESMLLALKSGKIDRADSIPDCVGQYVTSRNDDITHQKAADSRSAIMKYHMGVLEENKEVFDLLNKAIGEMNEDGTLSTLTADYIDGYIIKGREPSPIEIPTIKGAKTIKVAITGDLPPLDFITADGTPAGFNVAVLAEISKRANVNVELVNIDSAARAVALTTGKVDALFWVVSKEYANAALNKALANADVPDGVALTDAYYRSDSGELVAKAN